MSEANLYFNGNEWRRILGSEQAVRLIEELWRRAGGSIAPTYTLEETVNQVTNVDASVNLQAVGADKARRQVMELLDQLSADNQQLRADIKKLQHRVSQLEDAS